MMNFIWLIQFQRQYCIKRKQNIFKVIGIFKSQYSKSQEYLYKYPVNMIDHSYLIGTKLLSIRSQCTRISTTDIFPNSKTVIILLSHHLITMEICLSVQTLFFGCISFLDFSRDRNLNSFFFYINTNMYQVINDIVSSSTVIPK